MPTVLRFVLVLLLVTSLPAEAGSEAVLDHGSAPEDLVLRFERLPLKLEGVEPLVLELWGDGRVVVDRPAPFRPAGRFEARLPASRVRALLDRVARPEVVDFDPEAVRAGLKERRRARVESARAGRSELRTSSGDERIELELHLRRWRPAGATGEPREDLDVVVAWRGLNGSAWTEPGESGLAGLSAAVAAVEELLEAPELGGGP